jgi:hypothetical protein
MPGNRINEYGQVSNVASEGDRSTWSGGSKPDDPTESQNGGGTGKATNGKKSRFVSGNKNLRYPKDRIDDSDMDYLRIKIAEYRAPFGGSNLLDGIEDLQFSSEKGKESEVTKYGIKTSGFKAISEATGSNANRKNLKDPKHMIVLPIPQQLSDISAIDWTDGKLNPIEAYGLAATSTIIQKGGRGIADAAQAAKDIVAQLGASIGSAANDPNIQNALVAAISGQAVGALGGNVSGSSIVARATGQVFNPNLELLFNGVNLRVFPFTFEFFPRNRDEGEEVRQILRLLKYSMVPSRGDQGIFIKAPYVFQLEYMKGRHPHPFLNRFQPMALTNMSVNYTGSNNYSTFYDGTPTHIRLELLFKELNPVYKDDYDVLPYDEGVGF